MSETGPSIDQALAGISAKLVDLATVPDPERNETNQQTAEKEISPLLASREQYYAALEKAIISGAPSAEEETRLLNVQGAYYEQQARAVDSWTRANQGIIDPGIDSFHDDQVRANLPTIYKQLVEVIHLPLDPSTQTGDETEPIPRKEVRKVRADTIYGLMGFLSNRQKAEPRKPLEDLLDGTKSMAEEVLDVTVYGPEMVGQTVGKAKELGIPMRTTGIRDNEVIKEVSGVAIVANRTVQGQPLSSPSSAYDRLTLQAPTELTFLPSQ